MTGDSYIEPYGDMEGQAFQRVTMHFLIFVSLARFKTNSLILMVTGRNGHGPKWLWAEMTRNETNSLLLNTFWKYLLTSNNVIESLKENQCPGLVESGS